MGKFNVQGPEIPGYGRQNIGRIERRSKRCFVAFGGVDAPNFASPCLGEFPTQDGAVEAIREFANFNLTAEAVKRVYETRTMCGEAVEIEQRVGDIIRGFVFDKKPLLARPIFKGTQKVRLHWDAETGKVQDVFGRHDGYDLKKKVA